MIRHLWLLFRRNMLETIRQPIWVVVWLTAPLMYLILFAPLLRPLEGGPGFADGDVLAVFIPGVLALMAFTCGIGAGWLSIFELENGVLERLRAAPVSRFALVMGPVLRDVASMIVPTLVAVAVAVPFGFRPDSLGMIFLLLLLCLVTIVTSATSSALGMKLRQIGSLAAIVNGINLPILLLSGVLLPLSMAPGWMRALAHVNPLYYTVEAARDLAAGTLTSSAVFQGYLVMGLLAILVLWWATRIHRQAVA